MALNALFQIRFNFQCINRFSEFVDVGVLTHEAVSIIGKLKVKPTRLVFKILRHHDAVIFVWVLDHDHFTFAVNFFHVLVEQFESHQKFQGRSRIFSRTRL
ncbi:hypothetical protein QNH03_gp72 [Escherichia phage vB_EcoM_Bp10]|uniref:hypothetical protein n=1 Tax=Escherichia phage vB_EcoM_Bp10 TaxID=2593324 RepID=UPI0024AE44D5|nr:hypothetical protein QNH03_gp72 [Escherichia phage vB_EcoM_Bp10]QEM42565.1 hypothetical protein vBEcoMBp10_72 [Escherichia phage vB_EcoM_Bp10]